MCFFVFNWTLCSWGFKTFCGHIRPNVHRCIFAHHFSAFWLKPTSLDSRQWHERSSAYPKAPQNMVPKQRVLNPHWVPWMDPVPKDNNPDSEFVDLFFWFCKFWGSCECWSYGSPWILQFTSSKEEQWQSRTFHPFLLPLAMGKSTFGLLRTVLITHCFTAASFRGATTGWFAGMWSLTPGWFALARIGKSLINLQSSSFSFADLRNRHLNMSSVSFNRKHV